MRPETKNQSTRHTRARIACEACCLSNSMPKLSSGFTLVELIVVIGLITLLALMIVPGFARTEERNHRLACLSNLRQMGRGSQMYAEDDSQSQLTGSLASTPSSQQADDDLNWLHGFGTNFTPGYIQDVKTFCCPSTRNSVNTNNTQTAVVNGMLLTLLTDLKFRALGNTGTSGHSYEVFGNWLNSPTYTRKTLRNIHTYAHSRAPLQGVIAGPGQTFVVLDQVESHFPVWTKENYPNPYDGHGAEGANVVFADAHAEWIGKQDWNYRYELSQDNGRQLTPY